MAFFANEQLVEVVLSAMSKIECSNTQHRIRICLLNSNHMIRLDSVAIDSAMLFLCC